MPRRFLGARLVLAGHLLAKAWADRAKGRAVRRAALHLGFLEAALQTFGRTGMVHAGETFYPLFLLPDFHGRHFDEALRRLLIPGRGPFVAHVGVTGVCPSRCTYCYASAGGARAPDLGDERLFDVARAIVRSGIPLVSLGGGEPLSRYERLLRLVEILQQGSEVRVATSGIGLTPERARGLRAAGLTALAVSLDSDDAGAVNATRGHPGAFDAAVHALRSSAEAGLVTFVTTVVDPSSFGSEGEVDRFLAFVRTIHPELVVNFLPKFASGRAALAGGFMTPEEYAPVAASIGRAIRGGGHRASSFRAPLELLMGCVGAGLRQLNLDIDGNVTACISGAGFGNVADEPFDALYERFRAGQGRLKRGFFCAEVGTRTGGGRSLAVKETVEALERFDAGHADTLFQRLLDVVGDQLAWLTEG